MSSNLTVRLGEYLETRRRFGFDLGPVRGCCDASSSSLMMRMPAMSPPICSSGGSGVLAPRATTPGRRDSEWCAALQTGSK